MKSIQSIPIKVQDTGGWLQLPSIPHDILTEPARSCPISQNCAADEP